MTRGQLLRGAGCVVVIACALALTWVLVHEDVAHGRGDRSLEAGYLEGQDGVTLAPRGAKGPKPSSGVTLTPPAPTVAPPESRDAAKAPPEVATAPTDERPTRPRRRAADTEPLVQVYDPDGRPVRGALVTAKTTIERRLRAKRTGSEGAVRLDPLHEEEARALVTVRHARHGKQGPHDVPRTAETWSIKLARVPRVVVAGTIATTEGFGPNGVVLRVRDHEGTATEIPSSEFISWDRATGRFEVDLVPGTYEAEAFAPGYCSSEVGTIRATGTDREAGTFVLLREAFVAGTLNLPPDLEPGDAALDLEDERRTANALEVTIRKLGVDSLGQYAVRGLRPGWHRLRASAPDRGGAWVSVQLLEGEKAENVTLTVDRAGPPRPLVRGTVVDLLTREPIARATVIAPGVHAETGDDGVFAFDAPPGAVAMLFVEKDGFKRTMATPEPGTEVRIELEPLD